MCHTVIVMSAALPEGGAALPAAAPAAPPASAALPAAPPPVAPAAPPASAALPAALPAATDDPNAVAMVDALMRGMGNLAHAAPAVFGASCVVPQCHDRVNSFFSGAPMDASWTPQLRKAMVECGASIRTTLAMTALRRHTPTLLLWRDRGLLAKRHRKSVCWNPRRMRQVRR